MTFRQQKINRQLQKDLAEIIGAQGFGHYGGAMVSVTEVNVTPNLAEAKVFVSIFPEDKTEAVLRLLNPHLLRTILAQRVRKQMRIVPELTFHLDVSLNYAGRINDLLQQIAVDKQSK